MGGGPAGMMAGLLFARAGVRTVLLEKHADFLRDFRGDTIHPSTLDVMAELGLLETFLKRPHQEVTTLAGNLGDQLVTVADFTHLPTRCKFVAFMPQWDFLNFLAQEAKLYGTFDLRMQASAKELLWENGRVAGVRAQTPNGMLDIRAGLTIAADGRESVVRNAAELEVVELGAPMDVLWLRLTKRPDDPHETFGYIRDGRIMALIDRGEYWQCAYVIPKGTLAELRERGLGEFRRQIGEIVPFLHDRADELRDVGRREALNGAREPVAPLVPSGTALHRRCRTCDVADRRRRNQPRDSRCGCCIEHARPQVARRHAFGSRSARRSAPA